MIRKLEGVPKTREEAERAMEAVARATHARAGLEAEMNAELTDVRSRFDPQINAYLHEIETGEERLRAWLDEHPEEYPKGQKTVELVHGTIFYRTGLPALKTIAGWTWERVLRVLPSKYQRRVLEPDRESILADRESIGVDGLRQMGLRVVQAERFHCEPKLETVS